MSNTFFQVKANFFGGD